MIKRVSEQLGVGIDKDRRLETEKSQMYFQIYRFLPRPSNLECFPSTPSKIHDLAHSSKYPSPLALRYLFFRICGRRFVEHRFQTLHQQCKSTRFHRPLHILLRFRQMAATELFLRES
jgi:hypothetical protein